MAKHTVDDVFGVSRDTPLNYVYRDEVDTKFVDSLARRQHIVIFGSSKQGKTSLRKHCLDAKDYVVVSCQNKWTLGELHGAVLKECGFTVKQSVEKTVSGRHKVVVEAGGKLTIPLVGELGGGGDVENENSHNSTEKFTPLELDPEDANDVIRCLRDIKFSRYIVLEDFHYLPDDTQRDFSFSLKSFHENSSITFIIVGVWREDNRLIALNGDLTDRVLSVDVDTWSRDKLAEVAESGAKLLNLEFDKETIKLLLSKCFDSVHIVQEACRKLCRREGIYETQSTRRVVGSGVDSVGLVREVVNDQAARYRQFLTNFADGFQETDLEMPKWIVFILMSAEIDDLEKGIRLRSIVKKLKEYHPKGIALNTGNITQILNSATSLQNRKRIRPLVVAYDSASNILNIVDKGFLIWLASQDRGELLEDFELPIPSDLPLRS